MFNWIPALVLEVNSYTIASEWVLHFSFLSGKAADWGTVK